MKILILYSSLREGRSSGFKRERDRERESRCCRSILDKDDGDMRPCERVVHLLSAGMAGGRCQGKALGKCISNNRRGSRI